MQTNTFRDTLAPAGRDVVVTVEPRSTLPGGVRVKYLHDGTVSTVAASHLQSLAPAPNPKPFYVYTRYYKASGDCEKRVHNFATRAAQTSFIRRTKRAVTAHN